MNYKPPTIVLFDMDGTTVRHVNPWLLNILEKLDDGAHKSALFFSKLFKRKIVAPVLVEMKDGKRPKLFVHRALHKLRRKEVGQIVEPCPGIYNILNILQTNNIPMGLVSNGLGKGYGHDILATFHLTNFFKATIFREDIQRSKPHPDPILKALDAMKIKPSDSDVIWYIGDRRKDVQAAIAAQDHLPCPVIPFAYGVNAAMAILEHSEPAEQILMGWPDLEPRLKKIFKTTLSNNR